MFNRRRNPCPQPSRSSVASSPVIEGLQNLLSDTYILYIKTQNFHWNVTGPSFGPLHKIFDDQYLELAAANDLLAERIRALGGFAVGSCADFTQRSKITESLNGKCSDQNEMIRELYQDHNLVSQECKNFLEALDDADDEATAHMIADRQVAHEKAAWMLKSHLD